LPPTPPPPHPGGAAVLRAAVPHRRRCNRCSYLSSSWSCVLCVSMNSPYCSRARAHSTTPAAHSCAGDGADGMSALMSSAAARLLSTLHHASSAGPDKTTRLSQDDLLVLTRGARPRARGSELARRRTARACVACTPNVLALLQEGRPVRGAEGSATQRSGGQLPASARARDGARAAAGGGPHSFATSCSRMRALVL
jgi:hypothetical protein